MKIEDIYKGFEKQLKKYEKNLELDPNNFSHKITIDSLKNIIEKIKPKLNKDENKR